MKSLSPIKIMLAISICLWVPSCRDSNSAAHIQAQAPGVQLSSFKIRAGKASDGQLKQGLQAAANVLSTAYIEALKTEPQLKGHLRGTFHIEPDGTVRMFAEGKSEFTPSEEKTVSENFIGATFGGTWKFPNVGNDLLLMVDFKLEPSDSQKAKRAGD